MGVGEREKRSSETCVYRPGDQTARSSSSAPVPQLSIWNSHMWIFIHAQVLLQRQRGRAKLISLCGSPKRKSWRKSPDWKQNKAPPENFILSDEEKWNANVFDQTEAFWQKYLPSLIRTLTPARQRLYFPLRSPLSIRCIGILTQTPMCVEHIYSNLMFWYLLETWRFNLCFSDAFLLEMPFINVTPKVQPSAKVWEQKNDQSLRPECRQSPSAAWPITRQRVFITSPSLAAVLFKVSSPWINVSISKVSESAH